LMVTELVEATGIPRSRLSNHLACLRYCGFVETEPEGRTVRYSLVDGDIASLIAHASAAAAQREEHLSSCTRIGPEWV
jgi:DNA-binding transcriptional ArsR family regulator